MTGSAVRSDPGNRRSHGSVFDAMCLAVNCPTPQRARLFKARMQRWWACRNRRDAKAQEGVKPPRRRCTLTLVRGGGDET